jgi:hypothetical protein
MPFTAEYHGECSICGQELKGRECVYDTDNTIIHLNCPPTPEDLARKNPLCGRCFLHHAGDCG